MPKDFSKEEIEEVAKAYGAKLAFLLYASRLSQQKKQAWMALLPKMSLEQIESLTDVLEQQYAEQETRDIDKKFKKDLEDIKKEYDQKMKKLEKIDEDTLKKLKNLTRNLK